MSRDRYNDDCPGCRPVLFDPATGATLGPGDPRAVALHALWSQTSRDEREAFHRFMCLNDRAADVVAWVEELSTRVTKACSVSPGDGREP